MELARGVRDFPPEVQLIRDDIIRRARESFERHGFAPFASPIIEREDTLTFKFTGDEDVMQELFRFTDQGDRQLGLRFDLTVPLCRYVSAHKDLKLPFKRYEIGRCYRDGPIKLGRYREFWQCDADIIGSKSMLADAECVKVVSDVLAGLPFPYVIRVNNRKLLNHILATIGVADAHPAIMALDKLGKQPEGKVREELSAVASPEQIEQLFGILQCQGTPNGCLKHIEEQVGVCEGSEELRELFVYLKDQAHVMFDPKLSRGLNYYTGTVFEAFLLDHDVTSSVAGGGRYDNIIGQMVGGGAEVPGVGISLGIEPLTDALLKEKERFDRTATELFVASIKAPVEAASIADRLRARGMNVDVDVMERSISKNLDYADKMGIPFVVIVGEKDLSEGQVTLKNMRSGEESKLLLSELDTVDFGEYA